MVAITGSSSYNPIITINTTTTINEKLTPATFPQWRAQFEALLIGYDLIDFVTSKHQCLAIDGTKSATSKAVNFYWIRQDKLILHAILVSISTTITSFLTSCKTSHEAWAALTCLYKGKYRTRTMQLKEDLTLSTRSSRSVIEFLQAMKIIAYELAIIDHPISDDDLILYILNGLGPEFRDIAAPIRAKETSLKFEEIHDLLVGHENYIRRMENQLASNLITTVNYSHWKGGISSNDRSFSNMGHRHNKQAIHPKATPSSIQMNLQQIVQPPHKEKIKNGLLTLLHRTR
ncbi:uncharacterized protein LOC122282414 [Carya illinoinensis]|uniref:uncharacterized protein LOC122282414 n=1 Tax=Carya illinoinensis TaxID=32201 RepID=UPI001C719C9F|nr:uncharacterized protein LOC122282414 [Carya illinoinensis]